MNSFNTHDDTQQLLRKYSGNQIRIKSFNQVCTDAKCNSPVNSLYRASSLAF